MTHFDAERARIRGGDRRGEALVTWLSTFAPGERDRAVERLLGTPGDDVAATSASPGPDLIGFHASGVAPIVRAVLAAPVLASDVFVDLGAGNGKVALLAHLLTGATARGIELQQDLVRLAEDAARALSLDRVSFVHADAETAALSDGTVFYLYLPFTGRKLERVVAKLSRVAEERAIVVCTLGVDLPRLPWLVRRVGEEDDSFWLNIYDGAHPGAAPRPSGKSPLASSAADDVACERRAT